MTHNELPPAARKECTMFSKRFRVLRLATYSALSMLAALGVAGTSMAQIVASDFAASPDVYKIRAENDQYRVVEGIWKPGQRDQFHAHPAMGYYWATDCSVRLHLPEGTNRDATLSAGTAGVQVAVASHSVENVGKADCKIVMFESK
jgi:hypothetical protein